MKFKENLECTGCELYSWDYDVNDCRYPTTYELSFEFYGTKITALIDISELQDDAKGDLSQIETNGELLTSFEEVFDDHDNFKDKVREVCKKCWEEELDSNDYNYQGLKE